MLRQLFSKRKKIFRGLSQTYLHRKNTPYAPETWFDQFVYPGEISDRKTVN
jgi:hypothetical protein